MVQKRTHVFLPEGLLSDIDHLFGKGKRSAFLTEIVEREIRKKKLLQALDDDAGCWKAEDHPELEIGSAAFVKALRAGSDTFARVNLVLKLKRADYSLQGKSARLRLLEKATRRSWFGYTMRRNSSSILISKGRISTSRGRRCFRRWIRSTALPACPCLVAICCVL